jgi:cytochrome c556
MRSVCVALISTLMLATACGSADKETDTARQEGPQFSGQSRTVNAAESIRARQTHYNQIGRAMKGINDELKAGSPSVRAIQGHAAQMRRFAPQIHGWFPAGSGSEAGLKTRAKREIWSDPQGFRRAAQAFVNATRQFDAVARRGDVKAIRAAVPALGAACKGCHDRFRAPEE